MACNEGWVQVINYLEIFSIISGAGPCRSYWIVSIVFRLGQGLVPMLIVHVDDWIGRRWDLIQAACVMFLGFVDLKAMWGKDL